MADQAAFFGNFFKSLANKEIDFDSDTIKVMACSSSYAPNVDTHRYKSDVTNEVSGTNYTAGGATAGTPTVAYDGASNTLKFDADDVTWPGAIPACRFLVVYDSSPASDATRPLIMLITFDADKQPSGAKWDAAGLGSVIVA